MDPSVMLEMFLQCTLHLTLACRDTTLWPISGCITMSLPWRAESQPGTNGMKNADLTENWGEILSSQEHKLPPSYQKRIRRIRVGTETFSLHLWGVSTNPYVVWNLGLEYWFQFILDNWKSGTKHLFETWNLASFSALSYADSLKIQ